MKKITDLKDLMIDQMRDLYRGEKKLDKQLKKVSKIVQEPGLKQVVDDYLFENEGQIMRLRQAFELLYVQKRGKDCEPMRVMIKGLKRLEVQCEDPSVLDAGVIVALQHMIHYEMAGYGAVCTYAQMLGLDNVAAIIHKNLEEERKMDRNLVLLAEQVVNDRAMKRETADA